MTMTAAEVLAIARAAKPHVEYVTNRSGNAIGSKCGGRIVQQAALGIDGRWYLVPWEILVNGKPIEHDWII